MYIYINICIYKYLFYLYIFRTKWWSSLVEGLLSTGPTPLSYIMYMSTYQVIHFFTNWPSVFLLLVIISVCALTANSGCLCGSIQIWNGGMINLNWQLYPDENGHNWHLLLLVSVYDRDLFF